MEESVVCYDQLITEMLRNKHMNFELSSRFLYFDNKRYFVLVLVSPRFAYNGIQALGKDGGSVKLLKVAV